MPNRTRDVPGYTYRGQDDREGMICRILAQESNPHVLADIGPCYRVEYADGEARLVAATLLSPWFPV